MITEARRKDLSDLAEGISEQYFNSAPILPENIADKCGITYCYGYYKNAFDGLIEHKAGKFHIYLNLDRLRKENCPRARFTFGHELGHYFIDEHRIPLKNGKVPSHPSFNKLMNKNPVEQEADYFASCLLMPSSYFKTKCLRRPLSPELIEDLGNYFNTSTSSVIFRYFSLNLFPMVIILSKNKAIEWSLRSTDFKYYYRPEKGDPIPTSTAAGEYFYKGIKYLGKEELYADDWFSNAYNLDKDEQFYEKCYYLTEEAVLSVVWKKEN
jgi:Zn-dependent peptidase ImmA (M78 family)